MWRTPEPINHARVDHSVRANASYVVKSMVYKVSKCKNESELFYKMRIKNCTLRVRVGAKMYEDEEICVK